MEFLILNENLENGFIMPLSYPGRPGDDNDGGSSCPYDYDCRCLKKYN